MVLDQDHLHELVHAHIVPPPSAQRKISRGEASEAGGGGDGDAAGDAGGLVQMGFPTKLRSEHVALCACHKRWATVGFECPRCRARVCDIPRSCPACSLPLVSSAQLARSYHHLFPVPAFNEVPQTECAVDATCSGCDALLPAAADRAGGPPVAAAAAGTAAAGAAAAATPRLRFQCPRCSGVFCLECDTFVHETLYNCPGCEGAMQ